MPALTHDDICDRLLLDVSQRAAARISSANLATLMGLDELNLQCKAWDKLLGLHDTLAIQFIENLRRLRRWEAVPCRPQWPGTWEYLQECQGQRRIQEFGFYCRITPYAFDALFALVKDHELLDDPRQMDPKKQLALTLYRLGHDGNDAAVAGMVKLWDVGAGSVDLVTWRIVDVLLDVLPMFSAWPDEEEQQENINYVAQRIRYPTLRPSWSKNFCMLDGTTIPFYERPAWSGDAFYDRKCRYSLNAQLIVLPKSLRIGYYSVGALGSSHDSSVWSKTAFAKEPTRYLRDGRGIWADSAYSATVHITTPFKEPEARQPDNSHFNTEMARLRVYSEHGIGALKGRWQSLRAMRLDMNSRDDYKYPVKWITACILVHNFAIACKDESRRDLLRLAEAHAEWEQENGGAVPNNAGPAATGHTDEGRAKRAAMVQELANARVGGARP